MKASHAIGYGLAVLVFAGLLVLVIRYAQGAIEGGGGLGGAFFIGAVLLVIGILAGLVLAHPFRLWVARRFTNFYTPDDSHFRVIPDCSTAEARVKQGKYAEAIAEYRKVIEWHPHDVYARVQIADLSLQHFQDAATAEAELQQAFAVAKGEDAAALVAHRFADFCQHTLHQPERAVAILRELQDRFPKSKHAQRATARIANMKS